MTQIRAYSVLWRSLNFLSYVGYNSLDEFADFRSSQSTSVRAFADRVDSCAVQGQFYYFTQGRDLISQGRPIMPWQKIRYALVGRLLYLG
jgi:hypothetical protein